MLSAGDPISSCGDEFQDRNLEQRLLLEVHVSNPLLPSGCRPRITNVVLAREGQSVILAGSREVQRRCRNMGPPDRNRERSHGEAEEDQGWYSEFWPQKRAHRPVRSA